MHTVCRERPVAASSTQHPHTGTGTHHSHLGDWMSTILEKNCGFFSTMEVAQALHANSSCVREGGGDGQDGRAPAELAGCGSVQGQ